MSISIEDNKPDTRHSVLVRNQSFCPRPSIYGMTATAVGSFLRRKSDEARRDPSLLVKTSSSCSSPALLRNTIATIPPTSSLETIMKRLERIHCNINNINPSPSLYAMVATAIGSFSRGKPDEARSNQLLLASSLRFSLNPAH
jgi:hypothetical protein